MEKGQGEVSQKQQSTGVFNRYLNGVNLAPSNGEDLSEDTTAVVGLVRRGFLSTSRKSLNSLETFITPLRGVCGFSACFWGSLQPFGGFLATVWWDFVSVTLRVGVLFPLFSVWNKNKQMWKGKESNGSSTDGQPLYADVWRTPVIGFHAWMWGSCITCKNTENTPESSIAQVIITPAAVSAKVVW